MRFDKYSIAPEIKENLKTNGYFRTTDIQYKTIPAIMDGEDVLAIAQTGSGKTAAFAIPIINEIHESKTNKRDHSIQCLILVPTRELAQQIGSVIAKLSKSTRATSYAVYGGIDQDPQIAQLAGGVDILVATPGRMFDLIKQRHIEISNVKILVLDEADRMLDLGFIDDIEAIKKRLLRRHQTLFFSATINPKIKKLAYSQIKANALRIQVSPSEMVSKNVTHSIAKVEMDDKRNLLIRFLNTNPDAKSIVFVRTQVRAERVSAHLAKNSIQSVNLHGGMAQAEREKNLETFRGLASGVLIATDVTARGIDLPGITHVINYDIPDNPENYVHRIGRTGRGFAKGLAISFCSPEEAEKLAQIESLIETKINELKIHEEHLQPEPVVDVESMSISKMIEIEEAHFTSPRKRKKKR
jgi:ATP-dependent RNA helicase RhlE